MKTIARQSDYQSPYLPQKLSVSNTDTDIQCWLNERASVFAAFKNAQKALEAVPASQSYMTLNAESSIKKVDATLWEKTINRTDVLNAMSSKRVREWEQLIKSCDTPPFVAERVIPTLEMLFQQSGFHFAERVSATFEALSPHHITNSPLGFGQRLILADVMDPKVQTFYSEKIGIIDDLRVLTAIVLKRHAALTGKAETHKALLAMVRQGQYGEWMAFDGGALKLKLFKKGTVHIELHDSVFFKMNDILSMIYPNAIANQYRQPPRKQRRTKAPIETTLPLTVMNDLAKLKRIDINSVGAVAEKYPGHKTIYLLDPQKLQSKKETQSVLSQMGGTPIDDKSWSFSYDVTSVIPYLLRDGRFPDVKSHQYYPSKGDVGQRLIDEMKASLSKDEPLLLEPSAGQGHLIERWVEARWKAVELSPLNALILKEKNIDVDCGDFLSLPVSSQYDGVVMNPPFHHGQAAEHVLHAIGFLKPKGVLKSIFPASEEQLTYVKNNLPKNVRLTTSKLIENAFDEVSVGVVVLTATLSET